MNEIHMTRGDDLAGDRLTGCAEIAKFWFGRDDREAQMATYRLMELRRIPAGKIGGLWIASRRALRRKHEEITGGSAG
jgi:hypothetical protein